MDLSRLTNFNRVEKLSFPALVKENFAFYLLGLNLLLALFLRLYNLAGIPVWVTPDEAVNGVDAYSLSQTLRDHHGNFLPPMLESFDDWASPALTYLTVPFVWLLGLSEFTVRLPVALTGVASVGLIYLLVKKLTNRKELALLASFLLCLMPWHIISSRYAIPNNIVTFFLLLTLYLFIVVCEDKPAIWKFAVVGLCAGFQVYIYPTQKVFVLLLLGLFLLSDVLAKTSLKLIFRKYAAIFGTFLLITSPVYLLTLADPGKYNARFNDISILSTGGNPFIEFFKRYFSYFSLDFNFGAGITYKFLAVFYIAGIIACLYALFARTPSFISKPVSLILLGWLLIYSIPASLTIDYYHFNRSIHGFSVILILVVIGFGVLLDFLKNKRLVIPVAWAVVLLFTAYYFYIFGAEYFVNYPRTTNDEFQHGAKAYSQYLALNDARYRSVKVDSRVTKPYVYYLFYSGKDPRQYNYVEINARRTPEEQLIGVLKLDKYTFGPITAGDLANTTEIYAVKDKNGQSWYRIFASDDNWYVVKQ